MFRDQLNTECFVISLITQNFRGLAKVPKREVLDANTTTITSTLYAHGSKSDITEDGIQAHLALLTLDRLPVLRTTSKPIQK